MQYNLFSNEIDHINNINDMDEISDIKNIKNANILNLLGEKFRQNNNFIEMMRLWLLSINTFYVITEKNKNSILNIAHFYKLIKLRNYNNFSNTENMIKMYLYKNSLENLI